MKKLSAKKLSRRLEKALRLLAEFAQFTNYRHGRDNPYIRWLEQSTKSLTIDEAIVFLNGWYPISRHQPQMLLLLTSLFTAQADRKRMHLGNIREEDGYRKGFHPHYDLLGKVLIPKLGGVLQPNPVTDRMNLELREWMMMNLRTPAHAAGALAAIEYPALDVSSILRMVVGRTGRQDLVVSDPYLVVHVVVEPKHIIDTHEMAQRFMEDPQQREEFLFAFRKVMSFWEEFWPVVFAGLGYPGSAEAEAA